MTKQESLNKIEELKNYIDDLDKKSDKIKVEYKDLDELIKELNFDYVNDYITENNFGLNKEIECKIFNFNRSISSEYVIKEMDKEGYRPGNIYELLAWYNGNKDNKDYTVTLGSVWQDAFGYRYVPRLGVDVCQRWLYLDGWADDWNDHYRFFGVKNK